MALHTIGSSGGDPIPPGNYQATFISMSPLETQNGKAHRWEFKADNGMTISDLSDAEKSPTTKNKTGKWLCALATKPLTVGVQVDPDHYVGKRYLVIVVANKKGVGKIETFTAI